MTQPLTHSLQVRSLMAALPQIQRGLLPLSLATSMWVWSIKLGSVPTPRLLARGSSHPSALCAASQTPPRPAACPFSLSCSVWGLNEVKTLLRHSTQPHSSAPPRPPKRTIACYLHCMEAKDDSKSHTQSPQRKGRGSLSTLSGLTPIIISSHCTSSLQGPGGRSDWVPVDKP